MLHGLARFLVRLAAVLDFVAFTAVMYPLAWLPRRWTRSWYPGWFRAWCRSFVRALGVELQLHQRYRGSLPARYVLIANHPSAFEDIGIPALFPVRSVAKREVARWWIVGRIGTAAGTLYFDREDTRSRQALPARVIAELEAGHCVAIYPEGGCQGRRLAERFLSGAFDVAMRTGVPVLPVFLHYEAQEDFEWLGQSLPRKIVQLLTAANRRASYHVHDPVDPAGFADKRAFAAEVHRRYVQWQARYLE